MSIFDLSISRQCDHRVRERVTPEVENDLVIFTTLNKINPQSPDFQLFINGNESDIRILYLDSNKLGSQASNFDLSVYPKNDYEIEFNMPPDNCFKCRRG